MSMQFDGLAGDRLASDCCGSPHQQAQEVLTTPASRRASPTKPMFRTTCSPPTSIAPACGHWCMTAPGPLGP